MKTQEDITSFLEDLRRLAEMDIAHSQDELRDILDEDDPTPTHRASDIQETFLEIARHEGAAAVLKHAVRIIKLRLPEED